MPAPLTSFVGREQEIAEVQGLLRTTRLLTLSGAGGVGKTRLGLEAAAGLTGAYADGVWMAPLAGLAEPALVPQAVATVLRVRARPGRSVLETLADVLRPMELLLVLDNCEHLVTPCAALADTLLRACPGLRIVVTSRQVLGIDGEAVWRVPALAAPDPHDLPLSPDDPSALTRYGAVRLFVERAAAVRPGFALTDRNARAIVEICHRLDGIPLAIELAAARVALLDPEQIATRLADRFGLLTGGSRAALPQHQTLRALVEWSYDLLPEPAKLLLRRLSVFAGGWSLEAAEAVCADEVGRRQEAGGSEDASAASCLLPLASLLEVLGQLVDKSLVVAEEQDGAVRYRFLQTIREYGAEKLRESGERAALRGRHCDWFLALAEQAAPELNGPEQVAWHDRLETEHDNLRAALEWSLAGPGSSAPEVGLRLGVALNGFWSLRGFNSEGRRWLDRLLARGTAGSVAPELRARALNGAGYLALRQGDYQAALLALDESLALGREAGNNQVIAVALRNLGMVAQAEGDHGRAAELLEESLALSRELGDSVGIYLALYNLADVAYARGDYDRATALHEEGIPLARERGNPHGVAYALRGLGYVALARGEDVRAGALFREGLVLLRELQDRKCIPFCLEGLARVAGRQGLAERAARLLGATGALLERTGVSLAPAVLADHEQAVGAARAALGDDRFTAARDEGRAMTQEEAADYALAEGLAPEAGRAAEPSDGPAEPLTRREREVVALIARGLSNREIAAELIISERTTHAHVRNILDKLDLSSRAQVAVWAVERGLRSPS